MLRLQHVWLFNAVRRHQLSRGKLCVRLLVHVFVRRQREEIPGLLRCLRVL